MKRIILKISGEALGTSADVKGIDNEKVNNIALEIKALYELGEFEIGIVVGGGNIWRGRDAALSGMDRTHADYMGMMATVMNALAIENALINNGVPAKALTAFQVPAVADLYSKSKAIEAFEDGKVVVFGGGIGLPFFSTDTTAALRGADLGCQLILMAKNGTDGVYDDDPRKNKNAKRYTHLTYSELIDKKLGVMDLTAATLCRENDIQIIVFDMNVKGNIKKAVTDFSIGTVIANK